MKHLIMKFIQTFPDMAENMTKRVGLYKYLTLWRRNYFFKF